MRVDASWLAVVFILGKIGRCDRWKEQALDIRGTSRGIETSLECKIN